jgi:DNA-binding Lrp family transcriptional regulator
LLDREGRLTEKNICAHCERLEESKLMKPFFVQIKTELGKAYDVATQLSDAEIASEIYSTAGGFDLLVKFYLEEGEDVGHFINEKVHSIPGVKDTYTIVTYRAF